MLDGETCCKIEVACDRTRIVLEESLMILFYVLLHFVNGDRPKSMTARERNIEQ